MALGGGSMALGTTTRLVGKFNGPGPAGTTLASVSRILSGGGTAATDFGSGSGYGDLFCVGEFSIAAGGSLTLDLYAGGVVAGTDLTDVYGGSAPFRIVRALVVEIADEGTDATAGVRVGGAASNPAALWFVDTSDKHDIFPDGPPYVGGSPVGKTVSSTVRNFKIENLSTSVARIVRVTAAGSRYQAGEWMGFWGFMTHP